MDSIIFKVKNRRDYYMTENNIQSNLWEVSLLNSTDIKVRLKIGEYLMIKLFVGLLPNDSNSPCTYCSLRSILQGGDRGVKEKFDADVVQL